MKQFHYIYRITINAEKYEGFYYYGKHSTDNLDDGYTGSGIRIKRLLNKGYSVSKEIVSFHETEEECLAAEASIVTTEMLEDPFCLNLMTGGGVTRKYSRESRERMSESAKARGVEHLQSKEVHARGKEARSRSRKALWQDPAFREKMSKRGHRGAGVVISKNLYVTPAGTFNNRTLAAQANNTTDRIVYSRCRQNSPGYKLIRNQLSD